MLERSERKARPKLSKNVIDLDKVPNEAEKVNLNKVTLHELGFAAPYFNDDMTIKDELGLSLYLKWHSLPKGYSIVDRKAVRG